MIVRTRLLLAVAGALVLVACADQREERRVLVYSPAGALVPEAVAAVEALGDTLAFAVDTTTTVALLREEDLGRYSAVVLLNTSGDALGHRAQVDLERYVQAGGGLVAVDAEPSRVWPWLNEGLGATPDAPPVRAASADVGEGAVRSASYDGGRFLTLATDRTPAAYASEAFRADLAAAIETAIGENEYPDYDRARTPRVPEASRFQQEVLVPGPLNEPTELAVTSDGRVFFTERRGALKLYEPVTDAVRTVATLDVNSVSENGLIGLALDPSFDETGWLYLNYSVADSLKHRLSRFTFTGDGITDERVLLEIPFMEGCCHTGGSIAFDADGHLYVSSGDNTDPYSAGTYAPIDDAPGKEIGDARKSSANTQDLRGKILRITPQPDGTYTIPEGNLFEDPAEGRPEIYIMGNRNPYRISIDQRTGYLYWGEVGPDARADSSLGPMGYDEVNQARAAGNFGWPLLIADNKPYRDYGFTTGAIGELFDPERPVNTSRNNTGAEVLPPAQPAFIWYPYGPSEEFPLMGEGGRNAMAGPVYYADDFPETETKVPDYYSGKLITYDWMRGTLFAVTMDEDGGFERMEPFLDHLTFDHPVDMAFGPDGSLYVLEYGTYWFAQNQTAQLSRITFARGNRPPIPQIAASETVGAAPLTVAFSAEGTVDHDADESLTYRWDFGDAEVEGPAAEHTFRTPGTHTARLIVTDAFGATTEAEAQIRVGNAPPDVRIVLDGNRSFFWDGATPAYRVEVADAEDGTLGQGIAPGQVRVTMSYVPSGFDRAIAALGHQADRTPRGLRLIEASNCGACHGVDQASVGPSYRMVAERYADDPGAPAYLAEKIIEGGGGVWGEHNMAAHPQLARADVDEMVRYILSLADGGASMPLDGRLAFDEHGAEQTGAYLLTASYTDGGGQSVGPLRTETEVVLRHPVVPATSAPEVRFIGKRERAGFDGGRRPIATAYDDGAFLRFPDTDLTDVHKIVVEAQALRPDFALELRGSSPDGELLASMPVPGGEDSQWREVPLPVRADGVHDLYVVLRTDADGLGQWNPLARLDRLRFER